MLILSLWIVLLLGVMAAALCEHVSAHASVARDLANRSICYHAARAGVAAAVAEVRLGTNTAPGLLSPWNNNPESMKDVAVGGGVFTVFHTVFDGDGVVLTNYGVGDECGKININQITNELVHGLVKSMIMLAGDVDEAKAESLTADISDWIDDDRQSHDGGAEVSHLAMQNGSHECHNGRLDNLNELLLVKGMDTNIFSKISIHLTIHGTNMGVNLNTADKMVLAALARTRSGTQEACAEGFVKRILEFRGGGNTLGTLDKRRIRTSLYGVGEMSADQRGEWAVLEWLLNHHLIAVQSGYFYGISVGRLPDRSAAERRIDFVFDGATGEMKAWHEE